MSQLDKFTRGYIECALWSESAGVDIADDGTITPSPDDDTSFMDLNFDADDIAPESLARIIEECQAFQEDNARLLELATRQSGRADDHHGHDFWLTRNGHGAGFWDRGYRFGIGEALSQAAKSAGSRDLYVGDDGCVHHS